jgi:hypothetical protein
VIGRGATASNSSIDHPEPSPAISRPPDATSSDAMDLASWTGLCSGATSTPVPNSTRVVTAAACASVTNGSVVRW